MLNREVQAPPLPRPSRFSSVIIAPLLRWRGACRILLIGASLLSLWVVSGRSLWPCWFYVATQRPCPTCGITRGIRRGLTGDWSNMLQANAFAPLLMLVGLLLVLGSILPSNSHRWFVDSVEKFERKSKISVILLILFLIYGLSRAAGWIPFMVSPT